jgi:hypothetical protein
MIAISLPKEKVIRTGWSEPVPAFPALLFSLPLGHFHLLSQVVTHIKTSSRPSQQAEAPRAAIIPETKNVFPLRFDSLGSNTAPGIELKLPSGDNRIF